MLDRFRWLHPRDILRELLALDDTPHAIALGAAVGIWLGLTPTIGVQMILVLVLAAVMGRLCYFNRTAALLAVYVTNPLTLLPIYWFNYCVGAIVLREPPGNRGDLSDALTYEGFAGWWTTVERLAQEFGWPLLVGSLIVATVGGLLTYPLTFYLVRKFRGRSDVEDGGLPANVPAADGPTPHVTEEDGALRNQVGEDSGSNSSAA